MVFTEIQNLFLKQHGSFAKGLQFQTIVVFVVVMIVLTQAFEKNYGFVIILLVFALYIANTYVAVTNDRINDFNSVTMFRLQTLQSKMYDHVNNQVRLVRTSGQPLGEKEIARLYKTNELSSLYVDANMINFLFSIVKLYDYNPNVYFSLLKGTDNILRIYKEIDVFYKQTGEYPENTSQLLETALLLRANTINNLHDFIYTVPKTSSMYTYIGESVERYATLISRITDWIYESHLQNIQQRGINTTTKFVTYNTTKPFDALENHPVIPGSPSPTNIPFYT